MTIREQLKNEMSIEITGHDMSLTPEERRIRNKHWGIDKITDPKKLCIKCWQTVSTKGMVKHVCASCNN